MLPVRRRSTNMALGDDQDQKEQVGQLKAPVMVSPSVLSFTSHPETQPEAF